MQIDKEEKKGGTYFTEPVGNYQLSYTAHKKSDSTFIISAILEWTKFVYDTSKTYNLFWILDASGSMNDAIKKESVDEETILTQVDVPITVNFNPKKIELVKKAIIRAIDFILLTGLKVNLFITTFTDKTKILFQGKLTPESAIYLKDQLTKSYTPDGNTDIHQAVQNNFVLADSLKPEEKKEAKFILLTDGQNTSAINDQKLVDLVAQSEHKNNIFAIGVGDPTDYNGELLTKVSDRLRAGVTGTELNDHIIGLAFGAISQIAKKLHIEFSPATDLRCPYDVQKNTITLTNVNFAQKFVFYARILTPTLDFVLKLDDVVIPKKITLAPSPDQTFCQLDQNLTYKYCKTTRTVNDLLKQAEKMGQDEFGKQLKLCQADAYKERTNAKNKQLKCWEMFEAFANIIDKQVEKLQSHEFAQIVTMGPTLSSQFTTSDYSEMSCKMVKTMSCAYEKSKIECTICMSKLRDTIFLPCHHLVSCYDCFVALKKPHDKCPACTKEISLVMRCTVDEKNPQMHCMTCKKHTINTVLSKCGHVATCEACAKVAMKNGCPWCKKPVEKFATIYR